MKTPSPCCLLTICTTPITIRLDQICSKVFTDVNYRTCTTPITVPLMQIGIHRIDLVMYLTRSRLRAAILSFSGLFWSPSYFLQDSNVHDCERQHDSGYSHFCTIVVFYSISTFLLYPVCSSMPGLNLSSMYTSATLRVSPVSATWPAMPLPMGNLMEGGCWCLLFMWRGVMGIHVYDYLGQTTRFQWRWPTPLPIGSLFGRLWWVVRYYN